MTPEMRRRELETLDLLEAKLDRCAVRMEAGQTKTCLQLELREFLTISRALGLYQHRLEKQEEAQP